MTTKQERILVVEDELAERIGRRAKWARRKYL